MKFKKIFKWYLIASLVSASLYFVFKSSGEEAIRGKFAELVTLMEEPQAEGMMDKAIQMLTFKTLFAGEVEFVTADFPLSSTQTNKDLMQLFYLAKRHTKGMKLVVHAVDFKSMEEDSALVTADLTTYAEPRGRPVFNKRKSVDCYFKVEKDQWCFYKFVENSSTNIE